MSYNHIAAAHLLLEQLNCDGYSDEANTLVDSIKFSSTGTEILMAMRFNINEILRLKNLSPERAALAAEILQEIDRTLS